MADEQTQSRLKQRVRHVSLAFLGADWKDAYVDFRFMTWSDSKVIREAAANVSSDDAATDAMIATLKNAFVAGKSLDAAGELVDLTPDDLEAGFDLDAQSTLYSRYLGVPDPNASTPSPVS